MSKGMRCPQCKNQREITITVVADMDFVPEDGGSLKVQQQVYPLNEIVDPNNTPAECRNCGWTGSLTEVVNGEADR